MTSIILWFRNDLRLKDNPALHHAAKTGLNLVPVYILDEAIGDAQRWWLHYSLQHLQKIFKAKKVNFVLRKGQPEAVLKNLAKETQAESVVWNRIYEPSNIARDKKIKAALCKKGLAVQSFNGALLQEPWELLNQQGVYYKVFTAYWRACLRQASIDTPLRAPNLKPNKAPKSDNLNDWHLLPQQPNWAKVFENHWQPGEAGAHKQWRHFLDHGLSNYESGRDIPALSATSRLSPHLHFGEISVRTLWQDIKAKASENAKLSKAGEKFLSELGWREFSYYLLYHFPQLPKKNFQTKFNGFAWSKSEKNLKAWQCGQTGYPIVDAGMRELWQTGYMHNRVRMIVASFLTKHLLIDWRVGASWFWQTLLDADLANNSAGWQWVAGSGADAAPYFRIFNPVLQGKKFDKTGKYVRRWVPELADVPDQYLHQPWMAPEKPDYPEPIVVHSEARERALAAYKKL